MIRDLGQASPEELGMASGLQDDTSAAPSDGNPIYGTLSKLGLQAFPMLGSAAIDVGGSLMGRDPRKGNIFMSESDKRKATEAPFLNAGKAGAGLAAWRLGLGKLAGWGSLPGLAMKGGTAGGLQAFSDPDADIGQVLRGIGFGAVTNPVMAGAGNLLSKQLPKLLGRISLGEGGERLPEIVAESGRSIKGTGKQIAQNIYDDTALIRDKFDELVGSSPKTVSRTKVYDRLEQVANKVMGVNNKYEVSDYLNKVKRGLQEAFEEYADDMGYGGDPYRTLLAQTDDIPVPVLEKLRQKIRNDKLNFGTQFRSYNPPKGEDKLATEAYHIIRDMVVTNSKDPREAARLMKLQESAAKIKGNLSRSPENVWEGVAGLGGPEAGLGILASLIPGGQGLLGPLIAGRVARTPLVATTASDLLTKAGNSPVGGALKSLGINLAP